MEPSDSSRPGSERSTSARPDVQRLADAVLRISDVDSLYAGVAGGIATYLPGKRLAGIRVRDDRIEVQIVVRGNRPLADTAADVRHNVRAEAPGVPVDVVVGDILEPSPDTTPALPAAKTPPAAVAAPKPPAAP